MFDKCFIETLLLLQLSELIFLSGIISVIIGILIKSQVDTGRLKDNTLKNTKIYNRFIIGGIIISILGAIMFLGFRSVGSCIPFQYFFMELFTSLLITGVLCLIIAVYEKSDHDNPEVKDVKKLESYTNIFTYIGVIMLTLGFISILINTFYKKYKFVIKPNVESE